MKDKRETADYKAKYKQELEKLGLVLFVFALVVLIAFASYAVYQFVYGQSFSYSQRIAEVYRESLKLQQAQAQAFAQTLATLSGGVAWATAIAGGILIWAKIAKAVLSLLGFEIRRAPPKDPEQGKEVGQGQDS